MLNPDRAPLSEQLKAYMELHGLTQTGFGRKCGSASGTIAAILRGETVAGHVMKRVESFVNGEDGEAANGSEPELDATSDQLVQLIVTLSKASGRFDGVVKTTFRHFQEKCGDEQAEKLAVDLLKRYLATQNDVCDRVSFLLELRDTVKDKPRA